MENLIFKLKDLEGRMEDMDGGDTSNDSTIGAHFSANPRHRAGRARVQETPLIRGPKGQLTRPDATLFDDKLASTARRAVHCENTKSAITSCRSVQLHEPC